MSFIGNFAAAQSAKQIGKFNSQLYYQQAQLARKKAEVNRQVYENIDRKRLVKSQESAFDFLYVRALRSGAEVREETSPYFALLEAKINQAEDLAIADYNSQTAYYDGLNEASLLQSRGIGEMFKGQMTARAENIKGVGSLLAFANTEGAFG